MKVMHVHGGRDQDRGGQQAQYGRCVCPAHRDMSEGILRSILILERKEVEKKKIGIKRLERRKEESVKEVRCPSRSY